MFLLWKDSKFIFKNRLNLEWWKRRWKMDGRISQLLSWKSCSSGFKCTLLCTRVLHISHVSLFSIFCPKTPTIGPIIDFPGAPSSPGGPSGPGSPYSKETNPTPYSLFSVLISKVLQKRTSIQFLLTVAIIELGNMKSVLVEEAFTTLILSSLTLLLLCNCVKEFVLPWWIIWWL